MLSDSRLQEVLAPRFELAEVNVDLHPLWMSLPGIEGLPALVFFDREGRHVLTKSGFRSVDEFEMLADAVARKLENGEMKPYPPAPTSRLAEVAMDAAGAVAALAAFERQLFLKVNSNSGGFGSTSLHPRPKLLVELQAWVDEGDAPARVQQWIEQTIAGADRGGSPASRGEPLPDMDFDVEELVQMSRSGATAGPRWRIGIETLPTKDAYLGLRDPVDHGFFRYAAGPGWYHPHFERLADENLAWAVLLRLRGRSSDATLAFVTQTFARTDGWLNLAQASDPFYFRLGSAARVGVDSPPVSANAELGVQAWAVRADPSRCAAFVGELEDGWPRSRFTDPAAVAATPDAVGEMLIAVASCDRARALRLADSVVDRWRSGLPEDARLHRLAAGLCAAGHPACAMALQETAAIGLDVAFAPPLRALRALASSRSP